MIRAFICSRLRGETPLATSLNIDLAKELSRLASRSGTIAVFTPHVLYTSIGLDDENPLERQLGMRMAHAWLLVSDELWVHTKSGISQGMAGEIDLAERFKIPTVNDPPCWAGV
jgi:hypothetical protein